MNMDWLVRRCTDNLMVSVTICCIAGGWLASELPSLPVEPPRLALPLLLVLTLFAFRLGHRLRPLTTLPLFFLVGLVHTHGALQPVHGPEHIATLVAGPTKVTLIGRMSTMAENNGERTRFELDCESLLLHDPSQSTEFRPTRGKVQLSVPGTLEPWFAPGNKIMAMATVDTIRNYQTPGAFDYRLQMAAKGLFCSGWIRSAREILAVDEPFRPAWQALLAFPEQVRQQTADFLSNRFAPDVAGLYQALLIGSMVNVPPQLVEAFKDNGCFHVLSISGLHLSLLGLFCAPLFTWLLKRSTWLLLHTHVPSLALVLTAPVLLLYTFIAGFNVPAIRSLVTALLVLFAVVVRRQRTLIHLIAAAALFVLILTPLALFTPSFQLSFAAVLAINLIYPRLPLFIAPDTTTQPGLLTKTCRLMQSMLYVSLAATAGTLPILLYHFNRFSLIGPMMNLPIEPLLCLWSLPCGLLAVPLIPIWPDLAHLLLQIGRPGIELTVWLTEAVAPFPYASIWTITPNFWEIALFFLILFLVLHPRHTTLKLVLALGLAFLLAGSFTRSLWLPSTSRDLVVSFLDVGQGTATLVQFPDGTTALIDGGGYQSEQFDPGQSLIGPFLWRQRIWRLDDLIVTHPHQDHYNGLSFVTARFRPRRLFVNGDRGEEPSYERLLQAARRDGVAIGIAQAGDILHQAPDLAFACLGMTGLPTPHTAESINDRSLVLRLRYGAHSFLFPADIGVAGENRLLQHDSDLRSDVLLAPHHGSRASAGEAFLTAVDPALIVISASQRRARTMAAPELLVQWQQGEGRLALLTGQTGTITCRTDGKLMQVYTFTGERFVSEGPNGRFVGER